MGITSNYAWQTISRELVNTWQINYCENTDSPTDPLRNITPESNYDRKNTRHALLDELLSILFGSDTLNEVKKFEYDTARNEQKQRANA